MGLGPTLDRARLVSVRSIADPFLTDQVQQQRKIRGDLFWFVEMNLLKRTHCLPRPIEAQLARLRVSGPRSFSHDSADQGQDEGWPEVDWPAVDATPGGKEGRGLRRMAPG